MYSERANPFTFNINLKIGCLPHSQLYFRKISIQNMFNLAQNYKGTTPPQPFFIQLVRKSFSLPADLLVALH